MARVSFDEFSQGGEVQAQERPKPDVSPGKTPFANKVTNFLGLDKATDVFGRAIARTKIGANLTGTDVEANREFIEAPTRSELTGAGLQTAATAGAAAIGGGATLAGKIAAGVGAGYAYDIGQKLASGEEVEDSLAPGIGAVAGLAGPVAGPAGKGAARVAQRGIRNAGQLATDSPVVRGAIQTGVEFAERVPRFVSRKNVQIRDAATRAARIRTAPPPVARAIKEGVDDRIINTLEQADDVTIQKYDEIVRLAEESVDSSGTLKATARPEIVAGEAAAEQFKLIDGQRKNIGQQIGEAVKKLSDNKAPVSMQPAREEMMDVLKDIGVSVSDNNGTMSLSFSKTGFTRAQRNKIKELFELATEGGDTLTPAQIHAKDRLFSQLQRETRMEGIGDIVIDTPEGSMSLFRVFRDVYSNTLEEVAPEIKPLNRQYRNLVTFIDDIEHSIIKSGRFETNKNLDPAEFAQTNLRRLFSEAQSAADYRAIADEMDTAARALGYDGAMPSDLARFAYEVRKLYPDATPRTGFEGSIRASVGGVLDAAVNAGTPDLSDQQKALRELLNFLTDGGRTPAG